MNTKEITKQGLLAGIYVILCLFFVGVSYGPIQFRLGELLMILPFYNKRSGFALTLGVFLVNILSPAGAADLVFGTLATAIGCYLSTKANKDWQVPIIMAGVNGLIIGILLSLVLNWPLGFAIFSVSISETIVVSIGLILFRQISKFSWFQSFFVDEAYLDRVNLSKL